MSPHTDPRTPESLFRTLLLPVYPSDVLEDLEAARATDANPANNPLFTRELADTAARFSRLAPEALGVPLELDGSTASVHRLSAALGREPRDRLLGAVGPDGVPLLVHFVVHAAAYVGEVIVARHGGEWLVRRPLWESRVRLRSPAGDAELSPLMWLVRSLSDEEIDEPRLSSRFRLHVEVPTEPASDLRVFVDASRTIPRLKRPTYERLHKHLRAHVPELRGLGGDFPSAERFAQLGFAWMDVLVVGGGRKLLFAGASSKGVHLFWVGEAGFTKAVFIPADAFPDPLVRPSGETIRVLFQSQGRQLFQEFLWWGP